ncbi:MAG: DUF6314 family protein [Actinomycetota bacterium]
MSDPLDLAALLTGWWDLDRTITHGDGARAEVHGTATWSRAADRPDRLRYDEAGTLRLGSRQLASTRALLFDLGPPGLGPAGADVSFADERPFYRLDLTTGRCAPIHLCGDDRYEGLIELLDGDRLVEQWVVRGPAKNYTSVATLTRRPATPST